MSRLRVHGMSISLDGFGTGEPQTLESPFGHAGERLHTWFFETESWKGDSTGSTGIANDLMSRMGNNIGAYIMGRNMFSPHRGPWEDESWQGWWGENPPYHVPTFVMTHHSRPDLEMEGGTTFRFVEGAPAEILAMAKEAAGERDVQLAGGVSTVREYLREGLVDEAHIAVVPIVLGKGERLWDGLENLDDNYELVDSIGTRGVTHLKFARRRS